MTFRHLPLHVLLLFALCAVAPARAAQAEPPAATPAQQTVCPPADVKVTEAAPGSAEMEDVVTLTGANFSALACRGPNKPVILFIDSLPLADVTGVFQQDGSLHFRLIRGAASKANWNILLARPNRQARQLPISVGYADGLPYPSTASIDLVALPPVLLTISIVGFVVLAAIFVVLARKSDIIRSRPEPDAPPNAKGPYSLSKTQAAWWFFVVLGAYLFIGLVCGDFTTSLNGTALGLIAVGSGTAIGSALYGSAQDGASITQQRDDAKVALAATALPQPTKDAATKVITNVSQGFVLDILTDADGVCFHRFQIVAWTVVLAGVFLSGVYENLAMPDFDPTLFGLLGLSSLTYLGLKNTESVVPSSLK